MFISTLAKPRGVPEEISLNNDMTDIITIMLKLTVVSDDDIKTIYQRQHLLSAFCAPCHPEKCYLLLS